MVIKKPRVVIVGAGIAGLTAANKLYTSAANTFELAIVEAGNRIGGRINTSSFCGDRVELGATWIHGIQGSPVYDIARETNSLRSDQPWECRDGIPDNPVTVAEGGHVLSPSLVDPVSALFSNLMDFIQGKAGVLIDDGGEILKRCATPPSVGMFLRRGLEASIGNSNDVVEELGNWSEKSIREAIFAMHEGVQRTFTSAGDLSSLDYNAEREYVMFPGEEITIAGGYSSVVESLASVLPDGTIQLGRQVARIEWGRADYGCENGPAKLHFIDGSVMPADHVIVTVSLGVLKQGIRQDPLFFSPPLPDSKAAAIARLGYGVVDKVFLKVSGDDGGGGGLPFMQMVFHPPDSEFRNREIPRWIARTSFVCPIYRDSRVVLSWLTGEEALEVEALADEEIVEGFERTVSNLLPTRSELKFEKVMRSRWGTDPLFLGSYSYVAVGSSADDMDTLAEPLPEVEMDGPEPPLQILFAGEATHRTHYSTTHGAYLSGLREADRLLKHYSIINYMK